MIVYTSRPTSLRASAFGCHLCSWSSVKCRTGKWRKVTGLEKTTGQQKQRQAFNERRLENKTTGPNEKPSEHDGFSSGPVFLISSLTSLKTFCVRPWIPVRLSFDIDLTTCIARAVITKTTATGARRHGFNAVRSALLGSEWQRNILREITGAGLKLYGALAHWRHGGLTSLQNRNYRIHNYIYATLRSTFTSLFILTTSGGSYWAHFSALACGPQKCLPRPLLSIFVPCL